MNTNIISRLQPTTIQPTRIKFYPVIDNTVPNPYGVEDEAIDLMKQKPIGSRLVSCFVRTPVDGADYNGDYLPLGALLNADSPQVEALRMEPNYIMKKQMVDGLPIFTPCCVLCSNPEAELITPSITLAYLISTFSKTTTRPLTLQG